MQVKAVLFDLGGTLIKTAAIPVIYKRILETYGVKASFDGILKAHRSNERDVDVVEGQLKLGRDFWIKWNLRVLEEIGVQQNREFLAKKIDELWWEYSHLQVYPDVKPTLPQLKNKGLKLGIISNGFKTDLEQVLKKLHLEQWFDVVVSIDSCNCAKPAKEIFLYALNNLGVKPVETLFVGDSVETDYKGAMAVGIKPFIIDREGKVPNRYKKIMSLTDLLAIV